MSDNIFKRTKILATIGPATFSQEKVYQLLEAGVNGIRMNFSHGANEERIEQINWVRTASKQLGKPVAILQDLQGPKIRLGVLKDNMLNVKVGDMLVLDSEITDHDGSFNLPVQYNLAEKMKVGEPLYMFDGKIRTVVREIVSQTAIRVEVQNDGFLMSRKGLNLPDTDFGGDILTQKDINDLEWGANQDFDYVALSFIQKADDIIDLRRRLTDWARQPILLPRLRLSLPLIQRIWRRSLRLVTVLWLLAETWRWKLVRKLSQLYSVELLPCAVNIAS